ncbi:hypothetical protein FB567DRAFT_591081 [Paraphoma chrysanthemicola]|uniref:Nucleoside phosphorylase domain-containing protein n=1 Tax=Paraphoma chrysanthemicola TaxID=798071 RepID=A0A8K0RBB3_9PLEO|nr:hypothetical protein FB567DRAFT_591081 [Paraphoma chrysanthemicola]
MASSKQLSCSDYHVAWICPLADVELLPARLMLDEEHPAPPYNTHYDDNTYICGSIGGHTVVVATCPQGETGNVNAGRLTGAMFRTFPNIRMAVLVGIGGGIPSSEVSEDPLENVHLGDVVVGWPGDGRPACVYHDRGRSKGDGHFELVGTVGNPDWRLTNALGVLVSDNELGRTRFHDQLSRLQRSTKKRKFAHPGLEHDRLFKPTYSHVGEIRSKCVGCDPAELVLRPQRTEDDKDTLVFHRGRIATGNAVIRDGKLRDEIGVRCYGALCVEMEAAGVDVNRQCLVVRGISDYADSHKSDLWKFYAAGRAAAFTRELLSRVQPAAAWEMQAVVHTQISGFVLADHIPGLLLATQGQATGLSQPSHKSQHDTLGQAMLSLDVAQKAENHSLLKISIKMFQKLYLKEGIVPGDAAGRFASKLASILKSVSLQQDHISSVQLGRDVEVLKRYDRISPRDLKRLRNIIKSSHTVSVNDDAARFGAVGDGRLTQKRSMQVANIQGHEIRIMLVERSSAPHGQRWRAARHRKTETIAKVRITQTFGERAFITAYIHYIQGPDGLQTLNPVISVGRTLPLDSLIFEVVEDGDVDQLRHLLAERRFSLRDRDTNGTPLLHYAMYQPEMCRFLVENGADIDELAVFHYMPKYHLTPLLANKLNDFEEDDDALQRNRECRRLLLHTGADPTITVSEETSAVVDVDTLKDILDNGKLFIDLNDWYNDEQTLLINHTAHSGGYRADMFAALLDRGADIHVRDNSGRTCLHVAVIKAQYCNRVKQDVCALMLLIQRGANIFTSDIHGRSIFDEAYECHDDRFRPLAKSMGSYRGDLWDHVLIRCGLGEHIRPPEERIYHYTENYTEANFRRLWKGWDHLFPYPRGTSSPCPVLLLEDESGDDEDEDEDEDEEEDDEEEDDEEEDDEDEDDEEDWDESDNFDE